MALILWTGLRPVSRSSTFSLPIRMFHKCNTDQMPTSKDSVKRREEQHQKSAARIRQKLEDPVKVQENDRRNNIQKYHGNPEGRQKMIARGRTPHALARKSQYRKQPGRRQLEGLRTFIRNRPEIWNHMSWKTHTPVYYEQRTKHRCATCNTYPYLGFRMWWRRHDSSDQESDSSSALYECHSCFVADWSRAIPIGYEDFVFGKGKRLRLRNESEATTPSPASKGESVETKS